MELVMKNGFCEMSQDEMQMIDGGDIFDFLGDIYNGWCDIWYNVGKNIYYITH